MTSLEQEARTVAIDAEYGPDNSDFIAGFVAAAKPREQEKEALQNENETLRKEIERLTQLPWRMTNEKLGFQSEIDTLRRKVRELEAMVPRWVKKNSPENDGRLLEHGMVGQVEWWLILPNGWREAAGPIPLPREEKP